MEISSAIDSLSIDNIGNQEVMVSQESGLFSTDTLNSVKSGIKSVAEAAFTRLALVWSNVRDGVKTLLAQGGDKFKASENKIMGAGHLSIALLASIPFGAAIGVMGLLGVDIKPYLESN